jgi:hypothetical protein
MGNKTSSRDYDPQEIDNLEHDPDLHLKKVMNYEQDGISALAPISKTTARKITISGDNTYVAIAPVGSLQTDAVWQAKKIAVSGADTTITWAGSGGFNQIATDLTSLTYA